MSKGQDCIPVPLFFSRGSVALSFWGSAGRRLHPENDHNKAPVLLSLSQTPIMPEDEDSIWCPNYLTIVFFVHAIIVIGYLNGS